MTSSNSRPPRARVCGPKATIASRMSSLKSGSRNSTGYLPIGPSWLKITSPCQSLRMTCAKSSICAVVTAGTPNALYIARDAAADAEGEAAAGQPVHGGGPRSGDQRVPGVVIRCGRGDLHAVGDRAGGTGQRGRLLDVPPLGDEAGAEAQLLAAAGLVHQRGGSLTAGARQQVVAQFVEHAVGQLQTPNL